MTNIIIKEDCVNAPKKQFIMDFNIAFAKGDKQYVLNCFSDDIHWEVINHTPAEGIDAVTKMFESMDEVAEELVIDNILSHGDRCVANGTLKYSDSLIAFCDVYTFTSHAKDAKIKSLVGYPIKIEPNI